MYTFEQLLNKNEEIWKAAQEFEAKSCEVPVETVRKCALNSLHAMKEAVKTGLNSTVMSMSGMCGDDCDRLQKYYSKNPSIFGHVFEKILEYSLATSEENIRMGKIAACPTAGSCGIVPSVLLALAEEFKKSEEEQINALLTAGEVGRIISGKVALAGAVAGCQAECGTASAMAAAAAVQLLGGNPKQIVNAVGLSLKNLLGLTCDPVCGLVEIPCVKRNPFMAIHAMCACEMALAGVETKIPVDEIVDAMEQTGQLMSPALKESSLGGLARTKTALELKKKLFNL